MWYGGCENYGVICPGYADLAPPGLVLNSTYDVIKIHLTPEGDGHGGSLPRR